jgi:hypothetical protein
MNHSASRIYFERRAAEERLAADQALDERAAESHRQLAAYYRTLAADTRAPFGDDPAERLTAILPKDFRIVP